MTTLLIGLLNIFYFLRKSVHRHEFEQRKLEDERVSKGRVHFISELSLLGLVVDDGCDCWALCLKKGGCAHLHMCA